MPRKPVDLDPLAVALLTGLEQHDSARHIVLGGYFALKHYCDYRPTHAIDAWWSGAAGAAERAQAGEAIGAVCAEVARDRGLRVNRRHFGDTDSWELLREDRKVFSFQVASRTLQLEPYLPSPWPPLLIERLADNVGAKMNALVQRAAPRDFVDIRQLVSAELVTPEECWHLWQRKNPDLALRDAHAEVTRHLVELELRRPLESIPDPVDRERARETRAWFRRDFLSRSSP